MGRLAESEARSLRSYPHSQPPEKPFAPSLEDNRLPLNLLLGVVF